MLDIELIQGPGGEEQLEYIEKISSSLVYTNPRFMSLVSEHLSALPAWFVAKRDGKVAGLLPFIQKDGPLGGVLNSLAYYGSNGGVMQRVKDDEAKRALIDAFYNRAASLQACSATIITNRLRRC